MDNSSDAMTENVSIDRRDLDAAIEAVAELEAWHESDSHAPRVRKIKAIMTLLARATGVVQIFQTPASDHDSLETGTIPETEPTSESVNVPEISGGGDAATWEPGQTLTEDELGEAVADNLNADDFKLALRADPLIGPDGLVSADEPLPFTDDSADDDLPTRKPNRFDKRAKG